MIICILDVIPQGAVFISAPQALRLWKYRLSGCQAMNPIYMKKNYGPVHNYPVSLQTNNNQF
ncbi:MAG: hypothetical protein LBP64_01430, partial [Tannerella sp.]|jgi:hypothetical protein|nr:hypothetical protein [Tannerella sp.]